jgi:hypothetical protein
VAWEKRKNGKRYYYRVRRDGDRIIKEYIGGGQIGEAAAKEDADRRAARAMHRQGEQLRRQECNRMNQSLMAMDVEAGAMVEAALLAAGLYRHCRGRWRKRRGS